jgi:arginyl-tRNA synthetase
MQTLISLLQDMASRAIVRAFPDAAANPDLMIAEVIHSTQPQFGHYQCNSALKIGKALKKNPREVAQLIIDHLEKTTPEGTPFLGRVEVAGAGFINMSLDPVFLAEQVEKCLTDHHLGISLPLRKLRVIVEFSSPNVAKELHVGHLRSTIIGDCLARIVEFLGHDVLRLNHIGDWGTQFGMLITYMNEEHPEVIRGEQSVDLPTLMQWYKQSKVRFDNDSAFKKRAQLQVVALQGGDNATLEAWQKICAISRAAFAEIYRMLDVSITERGESFYNPLLPKIVAELEKKGLITVSDGAKCVFMEGFVNRDGEPLPMIVQKSDGGYNYDTTDMAALWHRVHEEKAERIIVVTDAGQSLHFQMIFKAGELAGFYDQKRVRLDHVPFGVVLGPDGKKFKTRSGETEKLIDLLTEAIDRARVIMAERIPEALPEELEKMAHILGIDAVKYADLSCHRVKDYVFSYERMLKFEGNTAAFLLYAYVRVQGIKRKIGKAVDAMIGKERIVLEHPSEIALALHLRQFGEAVDMVDRELLPNRLCDYLYNLAEKFHGFFRDCRVEGVEQEASRLLLCEATGRILQKGLSLLGLRTLDRM